MKLYGASGDVPECRHQVEASVQHQAAAALCVEKQTASILWLGGSENLKAGLLAAQK
jgi:hypothetical protein